MSVVVDPDDGLHDEAVSIQFLVGIMQLIHVEIDRHCHCLVVASLVGALRRVNFSLDKHAIGFALRDLCDWLHEMTVLGAKQLGHAFAHCNLT